MQVEVKNFKSLKDVSVELGKVTILIGPPNSGKSNFLEALELLGYATKAAVERGLEIIDDERIGPLDAYLRLTTCDDLIYEGMPENEISIRMGDSELKLACSETDYVTMELNIGNKSSEIKAPVTLKEIKIPATQDEEALAFSFFQTLLELISKKSVKIEAEEIAPKRALVPRLYSFDRMGVYNSVIKERTFSKLPPYPHERGLNLSWMLYTKSELFEEVNELLRKQAKLSLVVSPRTFSIVKDSKAISPALASDTIIRMIYYSTALLGNKPSVLRSVDESVELVPIVMLEEPEAHLSPMPRRDIVELMKLSVERGNFLIFSTHDPLLAASAYERLGDVKVIYSKMEGDVTKLCEVKNVELFTDIIEGDEEPC